MNISITSSDPAAKPDESVVIVAGGGVPVSVTFDEAPGEGATVELALSAQTSAPTVLAYLALTEQNGTTFTGILDANDSRLLSAMSGLATATFNCQVQWQVGEALPVVCPNFTVTVQPQIIVGAGSSEGGPAYYTAAQVNTLLATVNASIAAAVAAAQDLSFDDAIIALTGAGTTAISEADPWLIGRTPFSAAAGSGAYVANITLSDAGALAGGFLRIPIDFAATLNPTINIYDGSTGGTLLQTITNIDANARSFLFTAGFDGTAWHKETGAWIL